MEGFEQATGKSVIDIGPDFGLVPSPSMLDHSSSAYVILCAFYIT
jgi:hypothetical protein